MLPGNPRPLMLACEKLQACREGQMKVLPKRSRLTSHHRMRKARPGVLARRGRRLALILFLMFFFALTASLIMLGLGIGVPGRAWQP